MKYPAARRSSAVDVFHSAKNRAVQVPNPYDWLEDPSGQETQDFVAAQNVAFQEFLEDPALQGPRADLAGHLRAMHGVAAVTNVPYAVGEEYFFRVAGRGREFPVTYRARKGDFSGLFPRRLGTASNSGGDGPRELLEVFHDDGMGGGVLISSGFSATGAYWAYNTSVNGSDWGVVRVKDTKTSETLSDEVHHTKFTTTMATPISWLGDRGFFYQYWPGGPEKPGNAQLRFHVVGTSQERDEIVYQDDANSGHTFKASVSQDASLVFLQIYRAGRTSQVWAARVSPSTNCRAKSLQNLELKFDIKFCDNSDSEWE